jgi:FtsZ-interacting cell division protein ZipA
MNAIPVLLADVETGDVLASWRWSNPAFREWLMIFASIGLVSLLLLLWAAFVRKKRRRRHSHHHQHHQTERPAEVPEAPQHEEAAASREKRHRRRRSRHRHRPRNPTLAETGGLPPIRQDPPPEAGP